MSIGINSLRTMRIIQKKLVHKREIHRWVKEFEDVQLSSDFKKKIDEYWKQYGIKVSKDWFRFYLGCTGMEDVRFVENGLWYSQILCRLNRFDLYLAYEDKNQYDALFKGRVKLPETVVRNIDGVLYNAEYSPITEKEAIRLVLNMPRVIVKPTLESGGGKGICVINNINYNSEFDISKILQQKNVIVQKFLGQSKTYSLFNSETINTIRVVSFFWQGEVYILTIYLRVGDEKKEFVECHTRIINVYENGSLGMLINDHDGHRKPQRNHSLKDLIETVKLPCIEQIVEIVKKEHLRLGGYFGVIGWDFSVDEHESPVLIEINMHWPAIDHIQMLNGPAFGELTDEVMKYVFSDKKELKKSIYIGI